MKMTKKKFQNMCREDVQSVANTIDEPIVYQFFEDKFYTESEYKKECEKCVLKYKDKYTDEDWEKDKSWDILEWYYPLK